jgi:hypothetical protein
MFKGRQQTKSNRHFVVWVNIAPKSAGYFFKKKNFPSSSTISIRNKIPTKVLQKYEGTKKRKKKPLK